MRITKIEIKNFKGFPAAYTINLRRSGKNLLVYGENGSGKSSLVQAIQFFLESSANGKLFRNYQNIFESDPGYVRLEISEELSNGRVRSQIYEWSEANSNHNVSPIIEAAKKHGFVDYKGLLQTYLLEPQANTVNVFDLLVENVLANSINPITGHTFAEDWAEIAKWIPQRDRSPKVHTDQQMAALQNAIEPFNLGMASKLSELKSITTEILRNFGHNIALDFAFSGVVYQRQTKTIADREIILKVEFYDEALTNPWHFLNEARLSAITLSIYFASLLLVPDPDLKILALDDVLIGLDMSNRLPILQILQDHFADYQIILTTYDKFWHTIIKRHMPPQEWESIEMYANEPGTDLKAPLIKVDQNYIQVAETHLRNHDYKASAVYIRSEFERLVRLYCDKKRIKLPYKRKPDEYTVNILWRAIEDNSDAINDEDRNIIGDINEWRRLIMNPLSHDDIEQPVFNQEVAEAIAAVKKLKTVFERIW